MSVRKYFMDIFDGMAKGLFASLIVGTILKQIGELASIEQLVAFGRYAQLMMGACIGVGIALKREAKLYTLLTAAVAGLIGAGAVKLSSTGTGHVISIGEPVGAFVAALVGVEIGRLVEGRTKFDLLIIPAIVILAAGVIGIFVSPVVSGFMKQVGEVVNNVTTLQPFLMGILVSIIVGVMLTLPVSSSALCISIGLGGLAGGAALAGCCAHMVGFAISSFRENKISGLLSQGLGTSMIQMPNIIKNPWIWLPATLTSAITGPIATMVFQMHTSSVGAGMGTSGLVGPLTTYTSMGPTSILPIVIICFIMPAALSLLISEFMRKKCLIKFGDMQL